MRERFAISVAPLACALAAPVADWAMRTRLLGARAVVSVFEKTLQSRWVR